MVRFLIAYATMGGNTEEVALLIGGQLGLLGHETQYHEMGYGRIPTDSFDAVLIGTYTWDKGSLPDEAIDFVKEFDSFPEKVAVFGTGDTQFGGDELFCRAADNLASYYKATYPVLKIEQSPRRSQEAMVTEWAKGVAEHW